MTVDPGVVARAMTTELTLDGVDRLTDGRLGTFDVACPCCDLYRQPVDEWCEKLEADEAWQREREAQTATVS